MINNNKKTTILITSIMLTSILVIGTMANAYADHPDPHPFPLTPDPSNINVESIQVGAEPKAPSDPPTIVPLNVAVSNTAPDPLIPREQVLEFVRVTVGGVIVCTLDFNNEADFGLRVDDLNSNGRFHI